MGEVFRSFAKPAGQRQNGDAGTEKGLCMGIGHGEMEPDGDRYKNEEPIQRGLKHVLCCSG